MDLGNTPLDLLLDRESQPGAEPTIDVPHVGGQERLLVNQRLSLGAMARLQLARALARSGDTAKAKSAYNDLLTLWKNADPESPVLKEAHAEYARLP